MKDVLTVIRYTFNYWQYAVINIIFNTLSVFFALFSFTLMIPFLQILFEKEQLITQVQPLSFSVESLKEHFFFFLSNIIVEEGKIAALVFVSIAIAVAALFKTGFTYMANYFMAPIMNGTVRDFQQQLYDKVLDLHLGFYSEQKKGDIMARMTNDVQEIKNTITSSLEMIFRDPIMIIVYLSFMLYTSLKLTVFVLVFIPLVALIIGKIGKSLKRNSEKAQRKLGEVVTLEEETLGGLRIVKAFNAENRMKDKFAVLNAQLYRIMNRVHRKSSLSSPLSEFLGTFVVIIVVIFGGSIVLDPSQNFSGEVFIAYVIVFTQILNPAKSLSKTYYRIQQGMASINRVNEILESPIEIQDTPNATSITGFSNNIEFQNVSFRYADDLVLKNINLKVQKGKTIALVGQSGSGKSTLVDLIPRFYDVGDGQILIDGSNIKTFTIKSLRSLMGNVNQEAILFNDTIFNNITFGVDSATEEQVITAAKIANAHDFIMQTEKGYQSNIGDRGSKLSGGQRQRISIARAILSNPQILILDEATSALDTESEKLVQQALEKLMQNRTSIVIAHRLSTIRNADEICVLHEGEIVERGAHEELLRKGGVYKKLHQMQSF